MQSFLHRLLGWCIVVADTLLQRPINFRASSEIPLFGNPPNRRLLQGKTAIVTGANTGLGLETARWLAASGASVILACRSQEKGASAAKAIADDIPGAIVEPAKLDLSDLGSVREFATHFARSSCASGESHGPRHLHMLVLNAGVMCVPQSDPETHFTVNHLAHALLAFLLVPSLSTAANESGHGRIVFVSSITYFLSNLDLDDISLSRRSYKSFIAYANSKLCNVMFMRSLSARVAGTGIVCNAVHPGESTTDVARNVGRLWVTLHKRIGCLFLLSPREASRTTVFAAAADDGAKPNAVFHAVHRTLPVPERLVLGPDVDKLWDMTMSLASISAAEKVSFREAGGVLDIGCAQEGSTRDD